MHGGRAGVLQELLGASHGTEHNRRGNHRQGITAAFAGATAWSLVSISSMTVSMDFTEAVSFLLAIHAQGSWFCSLVGYSRYHAELCWRHQVVVHAISQAARHEGHELRGLSNLTQVATS